MIKKYKYLVIFILLFSTKSQALSPKYEEELYVGCFKKSIAYIGLDQTKIYCTCTVEKLSEKFSDEEIYEVFSKESDEIMEQTGFATIAFGK